MNRVRWSAVLFGLVAGVLTFPVGSGAASDDAAQVAVAAGAVLAGTGGAEADSFGVAPGEAVVAVDGGTTVDIPVDPSAGVEVSIAGGPTVAIGLPGAASADDAVVVGGTVVYADALPATSIAVQPADGGVQALVIIEAASAPTRFAFPFVLPAGTQLTQFADGSILAIGGDGSVVGSVSAPWATDANGVSVPTRFELTGNTITQVVDHTGSTYAYPVIADPCWSCLVSSAASAVASAAKWAGGKLWSGAKWVSGGLKSVAGKGKVFIKKAGPWALALCVGGAGWAYYRSDAEGWLRVADGVMGCIF